MSKKKVVITTKKKSSTSQAKAQKNQPKEMVFGKVNYQFILLGAVLIAIGILLMAGGQQAPNEWNENEIYSFRRTVLAPVVILAGLGTEIFAIFKK